MPDQSATIKLPIRVAIDTGDVGGPSAGLAFALELMQKLGRNVLHGHRVAATGEIELNGAVSPIGGIKQKTYGARKAGVDVFLVPAGQNARDARRYAGPVRIIPVRSLDQALHALATLPRGVAEPSPSLQFETAGNSSVFVCGNARFCGSGAYDRTSRAAQILLEQIPR